jgi:polysaccharide pyruvyl transferase WcaK-like protein
MRFLLESGTYQIDNVGDIAMLQTTVQRLRKRFAGCEIAVVTEQPERLTNVLPDVEPVEAGPWFRLRVTPVPKALEWKRLTRRIRWKEMLLAGHYPKLARLGKRLDYWATPEERDAAMRFYDEVTKADAVLAAGGGYVNDFYHEHAWKVFATLNLAQGLGKPTAMFGIGLGPVSREDLKQHGGHVLRRLDALTLRESDLGPSIAKQLSVHGAAVTGDDAIYLAAQTPLAADRQSLGVNLRLAGDAEVPAAGGNATRAAIAEVAAARDAIPLPTIIRTDLSPDNDVDAAARLVTDAAALDAARRVRSPADAFARLATCRVVITGAYHNAVFALSMGVPVVGLYKSDYYAAKLGGVARQFGVGMTTLPLDAIDLRERIVAEATRLWDEADDLQAPLRDAAAEQVARADAAYHAFFAKVRVER